MNTNQTILNWFFENLKPEFKEAIQIDAILLNNQMTLGKQNVFCIFSFSKNYFIDKFLSKELFYDQINSVSISTDFTLSEFVKTFLTLKISDITDFDNYIFTFYCINDLVYINKLIDNKSVLIFDNCNTQLLWSKNDFASEVYPTILSQYLKINTYINEELKQRFTGILSEYLRLINIPRWQCSDRPVLKDIITLVKKYLQIYYIYSNYFLTKKVFISNEQNEILILAGLTSNPEYFINNKILPSFNNESLNVNKHLQISLIKQKLESYILTSTF